MTPVLILGPTAGGKSNLAISLAVQLSGEIISADSMQIYRYLDAGTAKPSPKDRERVTHHLIDCVEPTERFTVADWLTMARSTIESLGHQNRRPIVVGGTNLYVKALTAGLFDGPGIDPHFRQAMAALPTEQLHDRLKISDPDAAERIHANDRKRLTRALEVLHLSGKPITSFQTQWEQALASNPTERDSPPLVRIGLRWPVDDINHRINLRVKRMFYPQKARDQDAMDIWPEISLPEEVKQLESKGLLGSQARKALGYRQVLAHLLGKYSLPDAFERTKIQTRRYGKQQRTWLRRFTNVGWIAAPGRSTESLTMEALDFIAEADENHKRP